MVFFLLAEVESQHHLNWISILILNKCHIKAMNKNTNVEQFKRESDESLESFGYLVLTYKKLLGFCIIKSNQKLIESLSLNNQNS